MNDNLCNVIADTIKGIIKLIKVSAIMVIIIAITICIGCVITQYSDNHANQMELQSRKQELSLQITRIFNHTADDLTKMNRMRKIIEQAGYNTEKGYIKLCNQLPELRKVSHRNYIKYKDNKTYTWEQLYSSPCEES